MKTTRYYRLLLAVVVVAANLDILPAQTVKDTSVILTPKRDSMLDAAKKLFAENDTVIAGFLNRIEYVNLRVSQIENVLKRSVDTFDITTEWPGLLENIELARENLELNRSSPNLRNLNITKVMLLELEEKLGRWQDRLSQHSERFVKADTELHGFWSDPILRKPPVDTSLRRLYAEQIFRLVPKLTKVRQLNQNSLGALSGLQNKVLHTLMTVEEMLDEVEYGVKHEHAALWRREVDNFWKPDAASTAFRPFSEVLQISKQRNLRVLEIFLKQNWSALLLVFCIIAGYFIWLKMALGRIRKNHENLSLVMAQVRFAAPMSLAAAAVVGFSVAPYLASSPPAIYIEALWLLLLIAIGILAMRLWPRPLNIAWLVFLGLFIAYGLVNLLVENSFAVNHLLFVLGLAASVFGGVLMIFTQRVRYDYPGFFRPLLWCFIVAHLLGLLLLVFGRVELAKIIATTAMFNFMLAINLYIFAEILTESLFLQMESTNSNHAWRALFDLQNAQKRFRNTFWWVATFFWVVALLNNLTMLDVMTNNVQTFLETERQVGNSKFTFGSIGLFILILWLTSLLSSLLVSFFGGVDRQLVGAQQSKLGTSMLLVRLGLLAGGFLLAVTASGIPLDNVALIIGALGVGIGFGLQNIVNNLVSGVVLAFEKPIKVGDVIEIGTRTGVVKEIGIRASKLSTYDGSDVVIPNGDLLSSHLINWTMSHRSRRIEIYVGVAYGSDLEKARLVITQALQQHKEILPFPSPLVLVDNLADNAVNIRVLFWPTDIDKILSLRSAVITDIHDGLREAGIEIPFPQRDLHIKSMPAEISGQAANNRKPRQSKRNGDPLAKTSESLEDAQDNRPQEKEGWDVDD